MTYFKGAFCALHQSDRNDDYSGSFVCVTIATINCVPMISAFSSVSCCVLPVSRSLLSVLFISQFCVCVCLICVFRFCVSPISVSSHFSVFRFSRFRVLYFRWFQFCISVCVRFLYFVFVCFAFRLLHFVFRIARIFSIANV